MKTTIPQSDTATLNALHPPTLTLTLTLHYLTPNRPLPSLAQLSIGIRARARARGERITRQPARDVGNGDKSHNPHDLPRTLASDELDGSVGRLVLDELVFASPCGVSSFLSVRPIVAVRNGFCNARLESGGRVVWSWAYQFWHWTWISGRPHRLPADIAGVESTGAPPHLSGYLG